MKSMLLAEVFGTAVYVQLGIATQAVALYSGALSGYWQIAIGWSIALTIGIYVSAARSGGHLNPALTFAFMLVRPTDFPWRRMVPYWLAQLLGAFIGAAINLFVFHHAINSYEVENNIQRSEDLDTSIQSASAFADYFR